MTPVNGNLLGEGKGRIAIVMLLICMAADFASVLAGFSQHRLLTAVAEGADLSEAAAATNDFIYGGAGVLQCIVYVVSAIFFLRWFHQAYKNIECFGRGDLQYSPRWAVGGFFVPFLNLVRPYQVAKEIYHNSLPAPADPGSGGCSSVPPSANFLKNWWGAFIVMSLAGNATGKYYLRAETIADILSATKGNIVADCLSILAAILTIIMVKKMDRMQAIRFQALSQSISCPLPD